MVSEPLPTTNPPLTRATRVAAWEAALPVGRFLLASGVAILFIELVHWLYEQRQRETIRDADIDMQWFTDLRKGVMRNG